jgi:hypothetical protein
MNNISNINHTLICHRCNKKCIKLGLTNHILHCLKNTIKPQSKTLKLSPIFEVKLSTIVEENVKPTYRIVKPHPQSRTMKAFNNCLRECEINL